jgi:ketosteroid isomerase-like protein
MESSSRTTREILLPMSDSNVSVVRKALRAFSEGDLEGVLEVWGPDADWHPAILGGGVLEGAVYRGHQGVREFFRVQAETWEMVTAEPVASRDLGNHVLVEVQLDAVGRVSGASVKRTTWNVFEIRTGKIRSGRVFTEEARALEAVGLSE